MNPKIIKIDLTSREFSIVSSRVSDQYIGGEPLAYALLNEYLTGTYKMQNYMSLNTGPLNGLFPFTSKSLIMHFSMGMSVNKYIGGGSLGSLMNFSNVISIEIFGESLVPLYLDITPRGVSFIDVLDSFNSREFGLTGRRSSVLFKKTIISDEYFSYGVPRTEISNNLVGLTFSAVGEVPIPDRDAYWEVVQLLNSRIKELGVKKSNSPSCLGCPVGCALSHSPESGNSPLLPRSLLSCVYAESIYRDIPTVFSCFSVLGLGYTHDFLESFSDMTGEMIKNTYNKIEELKIKNSITGLL